MKQVKQATMAISFLILLGLTACGQSTAAASAPSVAPGASIHAQVNGAPAGGSGSASQLGSASQTGSASTQSSAAASADSQSVTADGVSPKVSAQQQQQAQQAVNDLQDALNELN